MKMIVMCLLLGCGTQVNAQASKKYADKIFAQQLVEQTLAAHPELLGLELASTPPGSKQCLTIASNEKKSIGEKCDKDEFTAMRTNKPLLEKEKENGSEVYDVTFPIHDLQGTVIGTVGIDLKPLPGQQSAEVRERAQRIAMELEAKIETKARLFEPAP
jgi:hypothetical protein